mmetsp:Transcript_44242/g.116977  ORF Transcript_44242/g.116977 Transcript_44242/m.116977 type:complete len:251 (+) Transcript_44242:158-910(+)
MRAGVPGLLARANNTNTHHDVLSQFATAGARPRTHRLGDSHSSCISGARPAPAQDLAAAAAQSHRPVLRHKRCGVAESIHNDHRHLGLGRVAHADNKLGLQQAGGAHVRIGRCRVHFKNHAAIINPKLRAVFSPKQIRSIQPRLRNGPLQNYSTVTITTGPAPARLVCPSTSDTKQGIPTGSQRPTAPAPHAAAENGARRHARRDPPQLEARPGATPCPLRRWRRQRGVTALGTAAYIMHSSGCRFTGHT